MSRSTVVWPVFAVVVTVAVSMFAGGWVIGLSPAYTAALVAVLAAVSPVLGLMGRRRTLGRTGGEQPVGWVAAIGTVLLTGVVLVVVIQALPIGRAHSNPAIVGEPQWSSPRTRELMVDACFGCHSNEVEWPWYSNVAPISWAISDHVDEGREAVNYSEFVLDPGDADESIEVIREGSMPPAYYTRFGLHPQARLSSTEIDELVAGLLATPGLDEDETDDEGKDDDEDEDEDEDEDD